MYAIELYVPTKDNDSKDIAIKHWHTLEESLTARYQGFTRYLATGYWQALKETIIVYRILTNDCTPETEKHYFRDLAAFVKLHWRQETVLWTVTEVAEINFT